MIRIVEKRSDNTTIAILCDEPMTFLQDGSQNSELKNHPIKISHETKIKPPNQINQNNRNPRKYKMNQNLVQSVRNQNENQQATHILTTNTPQQNASIKTQNKPQQATHILTPNTPQQNSSIKTQNKPQQATHILTSNTPQQNSSIKMQNVSQQNTSSKLPYLPGHDPKTNSNLIINALSNQNGINWPDKELPKNYIPSYYDLYLHFPESNYNPINGIVNILFKVTKIKDHLFLNIDTNITINSIKQNGNKLKYVVKYPYLLIYKAEYPYIIQSEYPIEINYTLQCENISNFSWQKTGFLFCNGLYITRLFFNESKKLLPCYDDYNIDVSLKLKLTIPSKLKGFSNTPVKQIRKNQNEKEIEFSRVFSRSVGFIIFVGEFEKIGEIKTNRGIPIKAYAKNYYIYNYLTCTNMIKTAAFAINWIELKLGVKYGFEDYHIFFNNDISNYASASHGLIFCTDRGSLGRKGNFIIAHEVVHQWFGRNTNIKNLSSKWLNEGFANFIAYLIMKDPERLHIYDNLESTYTWEDFLQNELIGSFNYFKKGIVYPDENTDFEQYDDLVIYSKGAFIVKMFYDIIGERNFFKVCEKYLKRYKKADIPDFLQIANELLLAKNVNNFFDPWLKNIGFPVLFVEEIISDNKKVGLKITQKNDPIYEFQVPIMYEKNQIIKTMKVMINSLINRVYIEFDRIIVNHNIESLCFVVYSSQSLRITKKLSVYDIFLDKKYKNQI